MEELLGDETPLSVVEDRLVANFAEVFEFSHKETQKNTEAVYA
jgi:hypothetical protein